MDKIFLPRELEGRKMHRIRRSGRYEALTSRYYNPIGINHECVLPNDKTLYGRGMVPITYPHPTSPDCGWRGNGLSRLLEETFKKSLCIDENHRRLPHSKMNSWRSINGMRLNSSDVTDYNPVSRSCSCDSLPPAVPRIHSYEAKEQIPYDSTLKAWEIPPLQDQLAIIQQVEYYFSDEYMARDAYFHRQVRRKKEGYLSMKLITNFKKLRKMVSDPRVTAYCLRKSKLLQVNPEGTKVRRIASVPKDLRKFQSQSNILVIGIPDCLARIDTIMKIFAKFGDMTSVRLIRQGNKRTQGNTFIKHYDVNTKSELISEEQDRLDKTNAIIEFEEYDSAVSACSFMTNSCKEYGFSKVLFLGDFYPPKGLLRSSDRPSPVPNEYKLQIGRYPCDTDRMGDTSVKHHLEKQPRHDTVLSEGLKDNEDGISDDDWIQNVVNQVLHQTHKQAIQQKLEEQQENNAAPHIGGCHEQNNEYRLLHANHQVYC